MQAIFITSWYNTSKEELSEAQYFAYPGKSACWLPLQIVGSGPDSQWKAIQQLYFGMILAAERHVYIQSPYFIPDPSIDEALKAAALSGVDVRLMCAARTPRAQIVDWVANTYFQEMAGAGVRIFLYEPGYLQSKTMSVDGRVCTIGSANIDSRSLHLHYELNAVIYDAEKTQEVEYNFLRDLEHCTEFHTREYAKHPFVLRLRDSVARLFSPLL